MTTLSPLSASGAACVAELADAAADAVSQRFLDPTLPGYVAYGPQGQKACRQDILHHLQFLVPAAELGSSQPFVDYVRWLAVVLASRGVPVAHLGSSLEWLADFYEGRLAPADSLSLGSILADARDALREAPSVVALKSVPESWSECEAFTEALVRGDAAESAAIFRRVATEGRFVETELHLVQPALYEIGRGWQENRVSVAQEHLATAMVNGLLAREIGKVEPAPPTGRRIVLACVEGNQHALGLQLVADAFEVAGWETTFLGASTPVRSLVDLVVAKPPDVIAFSITLPHHLAGVRHAVTALRQRLGGACPPILVGGLAVNQLPAIAQAIGADLFATDAAAAVRVVQEHLAG
jgi:methanogenic corrinoid protein MtbC1